MIWPGSMTGSLCNSEAEGGLGGCNEQGIWGRGLIGKERRRKDDIGA